MTATTVNKQHWITPEMQLLQLARPISEGVVAAVPQLIPPVADLVAQYAIRADWYTVLRQIGLLPKFVPPLPIDISTILQSPCPPAICNEKKSKETAYTLEEKCTLILVPEELGTIDALEAHLKGYGKTYYPAHNNPLRLQYSLDETRQVYGNVQANSTYWMFYTNYVLAGSRNQSWKAQNALVQSLHPLGNWQVPDLRDMIVAILFEVIVTGNSLYQKGHARNGCFDTYTRVKQTIFGQPLIVGNFSLKTCLSVASRDLPDIYTGVTALLKFLGT